MKGKACANLASIYTVILSVCLKSNEFPGVILSSVLIHFFFAIYPLSLNLPHLFPLHFAIFQDDFLFPDCEEVTFLPFNHRWLDGLKQLLSVIIQLWLDFFECVCAGGGDAVIEVIPFYKNVKGMLCDHIWVIIYSEELSFVSLPLLQVAFCCK